MAHVTPIAAQRPPSKLLPGPSGSWPLRFDQLVQPVLDKQCVACHQRHGTDELAASFELTPDRAYENLMSFADADLRTLAFERDRSNVGDCVARRSQLLKLLTEEDGHHGVQLDSDDWDRLVTWMDTYAQRLGSFSPRQEEELRALRRQLAPMIQETSK